MRRFVKAVGAGSATANAPGDQGSESVCRFERLCVAFPALIN